MRILISEAILFETPVDSFASVAETLIGILRPMGYESALGTTIWLIDIPNKPNDLMEFMETSDIKVVFTENIPQRGLFLNGKITIKVPNKAFVKNASKGFSMAINSIKDTLVHELQHAYDWWRSNGKYNSDKKSKKYYQGDTEAPLSPEQKKLYYQLPPEYWARFSETIYKIDKRLPFEAFYEVFQKKFRGWDVLSPNDLKRLKKAIWGYWDLTKT